jgi:hypothetical protein
MALVLFSAFLESSEEEIYAQPAAYGHSREPPPLLCGVMEATCPIMGVPATMIRLAKPLPSACVEWLI